ncbi:MAG TPA: cyclic nucleotide-binding domain-containing protein [Candidatus Obscuribacterales bacterium]
MAGLSMYQTGDTLFREGETGDRVFFIMSGRVQISKTLANGEVLELAVLGEGDIVGEMAVLTDRPRSATVTAIDPTEVMEVARDNFLASMEQQPKLAISFLKLLARRIQQMDEREDERWKDALHDVEHG